MEKRKHMTVPSHISEEDCSLNMEVPLPGVKKDDISLKVFEKGFSIKLSNHEPGHAIAGSFGCAVDSTNASARYGDGLLKIRIPINMQNNKMTNIPVA